MQKTNIIKKNWEFQEIINQKKQFVTNSLILYYRFNKKHLRVGISVPKKFANAVLRNKYKRQTKAVLDNLAPWAKKYDCVLILRKNYIKLSFEQKFKEIKNILERIK